MSKAQSAAVLIVSNGNATIKDHTAYTHHENSAFLREAASLGLRIGYATIGLNAASEQIKNLSDDRLPDEVKLHLFAPLNRLSALGKLLALPVSAVKILYLISRYDLIYCYYPGKLSGLMVRMCRLLKKPYGLYVRGEVPATPVNRRAVAHAKFILATGVCNVTRLVPDYPNCRETAPMCAVFNADLPAVPKTDFGQELHGIFVGRVERAKGVFELLDALAELKRRGAAVRFTFVGAFGEEFAQAVEARRLTDRVVLTGLAKTPQELESYYRDADFFCLPTYTEGFPRVLYEAMAHGLPCINTMVGGIPSRMRAGENCLALKARDAGSIVDAISALAADPELARRLSRASLETFACWKRRFAGSSHAIQLKESVDSTLKEQKCH